jgi:hypothetical protein
VRKRRGVSVKEVAPRHPSISAGPVHCSTDECSFVPLSCHGTVPEMTVSYARAAARPFCFTVCVRVQRNERMDREADKRTAERAQEDSTASAAVAAAACDAENAATALVESTRQQLARDPALYRVFFLMQGLVESRSRDRRAVILCRRKLKLHGTRRGRTPRLLQQQQLRLNRRLLPPCPADERPRCQHGPSYPCFPFPSCADERFRVPRPLSLVHILVELIVLFSFGSGPYQRRTDTDSR